MALLNSHPDYLKDPARFNIYSCFLQTLHQQNDYWHALPREVARWWQERALTPHLNTVSLNGGTISIDS